MPITPTPSQSGVYQRPVIAGRLSFGDAAVPKMANLKTAERLYEVFSRGFFQKDLRRLNLSLVDWASRLMTLICMYIPQAYISVRKDRHKVETNTRNAMTWTLTIALASFIKNDRTSLNTLFNVFMQPKGTPKDIAAWKHRLLTMRRDDLFNQLGNPKLTQADGLALEELRTKLAEIKSGLGELKGSVTTEKAQNLVNQFGPETLLKEEPRYNPLRPVLDLLEELSDVPTNKFWRIRWKTNRAIRKLNKQLKKAEKQWNKLPGKLQKAEGKLSRISAESQGNWIHKILNRFRLEFDYTEVLKAQGLKLGIKDRATASWATLDSNQFQHVLQRLQTLSAEAPETLSQADRQFIKIAPKFLRRMTAFKALSSVFFIGMQAYFLGYFVMMLVTKYLAPLDHDFDPTKKRKPAPLPPWLRKTLDAVGIRAKAFEETPPAANPSRVTTGGVQA